MSNRHSKPRKSEAEKQHHNNWITLGIVLLAGMLVLVVILVPLSWQDQVRAIRTPSVQTGPEINRPDSLMQVLPSLEDARGKNVNIFGEQSFIDAARQTFGTVHAILMDRPTLREAVALSGDGSGDIVCVNGDGTFKTFHFQHIFYAPDYVVVRAAQCANGFIFPGFSMANYPATPMPPLP